MASRLCPARKGWPQTPFGGHAALSAHFRLSRNISTIYEASALRRFGGSCRQGSVARQSKSAIASGPFRGLTDKWIMLNRVYCTYFDHNYLSRGLALYHSLQRHAPGARLWVLCLSEACHRILVSLDLPGLVPVRLAGFRGRRSRGCRDPIDPQHRRILLHLHAGLDAACLGNAKPDAEWITYLDGDLYFFASPEAVYEELTEASVAIIPHRYAAQPGEAPKFRDLQCRMGWRPQRSGRHCRHQMVAGTMHRMVPRPCRWRPLRRSRLSRFVSAAVDACKVIENVGANLAPWNIGNYRIDFRDGRVMIDATPADLLPLSGAAKRIAVVHLQQPPHLRCAVFPQISASISTALCR